jgi:hypothetical protein
MEAGMTISADDERELRRLLAAASTEKLLREAMKVIGRPRWELKTEIERYGRGVVVDSIVARYRRTPLMWGDLVGRLR